MIEIVLLIIGLAGLWLGAELAIRGALRLAKYYNLSRAFIGLAILSIGTDLPEIFIHVVGGVHRFFGMANSGLIIGETIGTCIGQIGLAVGITGLFGALTITKKQLGRDGLILLFCTLLIFTFSFDGAISGVEGVFLLVCFLAYMVYLFRKEHFQEKIEKPITETILWAFFALIMGFFILIFASELTVTNALRLSENFGIRQSFIGILIVGLGTSLPEIATSVSAIKRKAGSLAVGNLIGSNILDLLLTPGLGAMIAPLIVSSVLLFDLFFLLLLSTVIIAFFKTGRVIDRRESRIILLVYFSYIVFKVITI